MRLRYSMLVLLPGLVALAAACTAGSEEIPAASGGATSSAGSTASAGSAPVGSGGTTSSAGGSGGSTSSAGSAAVGGSDGSGGSASTGTGGSGGTGGGPTVDAGFNGGMPFRFDMPCLYEGDGSPLASCSEGEVCWVAENDTPANPHQETEVIPIGGDPALTYRIKVRIRGIMEPKNYTNGCEAQFMRETPAPGETRSIFVCKASDTTSWNDTYNVWRLTIADPPQTFYLNADNENPGHRVNTVDGEFSFDAKGGTYIEVQFDDLNGGQIRNCSLTVPELSPTPFDGNFFQLDVVETTLAP